MSRIPNVKTWRVTFENGTTAEVYAPTRRLAVMNVRADGKWGAIKKVGVVR